jgi:hypothetical protein
MSKICLGRRGSGVQIAPPRPIESIKYGLFGEAVKSSVDDIEDAESFAIRPMAHHNREPASGPGGRWFESTRPDHPFQSDAARSPAAREFSVDKNVDDKILTARGRVRGPHSTRGTATSDWALHI